MSSRRLSAIRKGDKLGTYCALARLGAGGNGEVWLVESTEGRFALKALHPRFGPNSDRRKRFLREMRVHKNELCDFSGIVPTLDSSAENDQRLWFTMPIATPIEKSLGITPPLEQVLDALTSLAETLGRMHELGIVHRDIKPDNLFNLESRWCFGDLGLVDLPDAEALTGRQPLGPMAFMAPEMLTDPANADGTKADVYSLAKTLWALATGSKVPPLGPHIAGIDGWSLRHYGLTDDVTPYLDHLIQRSTSHDPKARPSAREFMAEIVEMKETRVVQKDVPDLSVQSRKLAALMAPSEERERAAAWRITQVVELRDRLMPQADKIEAALRDADLPLAGTLAGSVIRNAGSNFVIVGEENQLSWTCTVMAKYSTGLMEPNHERHLQLASGFYLVPSRDNQMLIGAGHVILPATVVWFDEQLQPMGSMAADRYATDLMEQLKEQLPKAVASFIETFGNLDYVNEPPKP